MVQNYYTLMRLAEELNRSVAQSKIIEIFTQSKNILSIGLATPRREVSLLEISLEPKQAFLVLRGEYRRKQKDSVDLFAQAAGQKIEKIFIDSHSRVVHIRLISGLSLLVEFFGKMNVFLTDERQKIIEAFSESKKWQDQTYSAAAPSAQPDLESFENFSRLFSSVDQLKSALGGGLAQLNKTLTMEFLWNLGDGRDLRAAFELLQTMIGQLRAGKPRIYWRGEEPLVLSLIELNHLVAKFPSVRPEKFDSLNKAIQIYTAQKAVFERKRQMADEFLRACRLRIKKNKTLMDQLAEDQSRALRFGEYEQKANLLNIHIGQLRRGMTEIVLPDLYSEIQGNITIPLDPEKTPQENIARYFAQSKKLKNSIRKIEERLSVLNKENQSLQKWYETFSDREKLDWKELEKSHQRFVTEGWIKAVRESVKKTATAPVFREFIVHGRWRVFVGQNDEKNDQLTFEFAKKDDLWFHARGVPGSHVVLKRDGRKDNPGKAAIEEAASIAAFFSKAKTSSLVPVIAAEKKYVRKPKGAKPGTVVVERETVLVVPPKEPVRVAAEEP